MPEGNGDANAGILEEVGRLNIWVVVMAGVQLEMLKLLNEQVQRIDQLESRYSSAMQYLKSEE